MLFRSEGVSLDYSFKAGVGSKDVKDAPAKPVTQNIENKPATNTPKPVQRASFSRFSRPSNGRIEAQFDVSDKEQWVIANRLLDKFGGTIHEVMEEQ